MNSHNIFLNDHQNYLKFIWLPYFSLSITETGQNSVDTDQTQQNLVSDLGLYFLPVSRQFLVTSASSKMDLLKLQYKYG